MKASREGEIDIVTLLLNKNANVDAVTSDVSAKWSL